MKRMTAWLTAFCLIASCILPVRAQEADGMDLPGTVGEDSLFSSPGMNAVPEGGVGEENVKTPVGDVNDDPVTGEGNSVTGTGSENKAPEDEDKNNTPGAGDENKTPEDEDKKETPEDEDKKETPDEDKKETLDDDETEKPEDGDETEKSDDQDETKKPGTGDKTETPEDDENADPEADDPLTEPGQQPIVTDPDSSWNDSQVSGSITGGIEVVLMNALPVEVSGVENGGGIALNVTLENKGSKEVRLGNNAQKHMVSFDDLESGTYHLRITETQTGDSGYGFLAYEQDIVVSGDIKTAEIYTGFVELPGIEYVQGMTHPGAMLIGDVNRDGRLDDADKDAIMQAISQGTAGATDLNKDGITDLVDLQYFTNSKTMLDANADTSAVLCSRVSPNAVQVNIKENTMIEEGDPAELLKDGGLLKLKNASGQEISAASPVEIGFNLEGGQQAAQEVEQITVAMSGNAIESGVLTVETTDAANPVLFYQIEGGKVLSAVRTASLQPQSQDQEGALTIDLGGQIAVKKVTLMISGMKFGGSLAAISQVEFLNDMENRIPVPDMNVPDGLVLTGGNKSFRATWNAQVNVTGYEVQITYQGETEERRVASNQLEVKSFKGGRLKNGEIYEVRVQSVNGTWSSGYCSPASVSPIVSGRPDAPDNLRAVGGYCRISLTWKNMEDTDYYNIYYKEAGAASFTQISGVDQNRHIISNLKDETTYEVYVTGVNEIGESNPSIHSEARTITLKPAQMPNYKLINESNGKGKVSAHITNVTRGRGSMVSSPLDTADKSALGTVDKDAASYYQVLDWDDGASYPAATKGLLFTFDDYYQMSYITFAEVEDISWYSGAYVYYYDREHPEGTAAGGLSLVQKTDENGRKYYMIKLASPITANKIRLGFTRGDNLRNIIISEVNFYYYDSLEDDILALYADDLHTTLRSDVTEAVIQELQKRLDTKDAKSGEYHPERAMLQRELDNARGLLTSDFQGVVEINAKITGAKDRHLGFGGLNAWQPLGVTAYEGEQLVVYVGHDQLKTGSDSALKLIATQYHAEAGAFASEIANLKVGRNEITIPAIQTLACEGGGALYIQYTGNNENDRYAVRVSGGAREPVLNLYGVNDSAQRKERIAAYVAELEKHVASLPEQHKNLHETVAGSKVNRSYEKQNCILGATDIMLDQMMLSVSAEQILAGLGKGSTQERADKLEQSLKAMEDMMVLFYQHKGLSNEASAPATDRLPAQHLNIRYMRMFAGAFMYAAGNHIGIEWGSVSGLSSAVPVQTDEAGRYAGGRYFGWGISHEIGHNINQGSYAIAEVTNNYFAQLTKSEDSNATVRFKYDEVYKKVTSNTVGKPSNVFTHLAMYWQLHLAYDRGYNYKTYDSYEQQQANLFYARVDSYSRDPYRAPGNLQLNGGSDQNIMRLACAAAQKDLTEFFVRWGLVPDAETIRYAGQFDKEERALYYLTDDARVYEIEHGTAGSIKGANVVGSGSSVRTGSSIPNEVTVSIESTADENIILGYEIARYQYENGIPVRQVIGFTTGTEYVDHVATINNRVLAYEVTAVDKFGYRSNAQGIGSVRISHDGSQDKSMWTVTANMRSIADTTQEAEEEDPCAPEPVPAVSMVIDGDYKKDYEGMTGGSDAQITIQMNQVLEVCGLKYTVKSGTPIGAYTIEVSMDGGTWTTVKTGSFDNKTGSQTVYFENSNKDPWVCTYDAAYVRLSAKGQSSVSIAEIDLLGPSGDSISFGVRESDTQGAVGLLSEDYIYEEGKMIPKGSLVFTGSYKGNPAYNVVILFDEERNIVGGVDEENVLKSEQIILANVPENGLLGEVSDGIWIYWIEPEQIPGDLKGKKVRAQLYRVDHALTNEGQRLVSDTMPIRIPDQLESITLKNNVQESE